MKRGFPESSPSAWRSFLTALLRLRSKSMPEPFLQFFPGDDLAGPLEEHGQDLKRLLLKFDLQAGLAEFADAQVELEKAEADDVLIGSWVERGSRHTDHFYWRLRSLPSLAATSVIQRGSYFLREPIFSIR